MSDLLVNILNYSPVGISLEGALNCRTLEEVSAVDDGECGEVHLLDVLETVPATQLDKIATTLVRKVKLGGYLILKGLNVRAVCREYMRDNIDSNILNQLLFGDGEVKRQRILPLEHLEQVVQQAGCKLVQKSLDGYYYYLVGQRVN
jgi:hypothetical protein